MKAIFEQLGYAVSEKGNLSGGKTFTFYYISNTDGSIRWLWPSHVKRPLFLKFYNVGSFIAGLFVLLVKLIFKFGLQRIAFKRKIMQVIHTGSFASGFFMEKQWALFTGTPGPNNKALLFMRTAECDSFLKIAISPVAEHLLKKENNFAQCFGNRIQSFRIPEVTILSNHIIQMSDVSNQGERSDRITPFHLNALIELNELTGITMPLSENTGLQQLKATLSTLEKSTDTRLPKGMIRKLACMVNEFDENELMEVCLSHGDFTPWNIFVNDDSISLYDWEMADSFRPLGFDLFHFIIQQGILVEQKNWTAIYGDIERYADSALFSKLSKFGGADRDKYLKLYLVFNTLYYLNVYASQEKWHAQVQWLLATWNEALSMFTNSYDTQRELVLIDSFDFLVNKPYAAIKFQNMYPERLSQFSDVDLFAGKQTTRELAAYLTCHPLTKEIRRFSKSYMTTLQVFCHDGQLLSIDLIHTAKSKGIQTLDSELLLNNAYTNFFGIKQLELLDNARYIALFYVMNRAKIPARYTHYEEIMSRSPEIIDRWLYPYYVDENYQARYLRSYVRSLPYNKGLKGMMNKINYVLDSLRVLLLNPGTVITFSGVDGAGKSTVINDLKYRIEKQLRKRVVVLRHRPSVLPILSAWTKGKANAEQEAVSRLPRTGTNINFFSSLLRFCYYYTDYLLGQFLVYTRYVLRGYVVIYDRYYFDFMNDSKRSNIILPGFILRSGFNLLLKPAYNFFLYAPTEIIHSRKKELPAEVIEALTNSYRSQFNELERKSRHSRYISINNIHLTDTVQQVFTQITRQAA